MRHTVYETDVVARNTPATHTHEPVYRKQTPPHSSASRRIERGAARGRISRLEDYGKVQQRGDVLNGVSDLLTRQLHRFLEKAYLYA